MKRNAITIKNSILINRSKETVWDYTQDYNNRSSWDQSIISATSLPSAESRIIQLKAKGNTTMTFVYKLDDRPNTTTLATRDVESPIIESAGGSWNYKDHNNGTFWSQTNTIVFKRSFFLPVLLPVYKLIFNQQMKKAMKNAKKILER